MSEQIDIAMVLAAGLGTRMRPLTLERPKPLVVLNQKTLLDHVLDRIAEAGISSAVVNVHYHAAMIEAALAARSSPVIQISDERDALLDTGGGVMRALPRFGGKSFLIHNSDSVWLEDRTSNLAKLIKAWEPQRMDCLMLLAAARDSIGFTGRGDFKMLPNGLLRSFRKGAKRLQRRAEQGSAPFVYAGVSIAHPRMFEGAPDGPFSLNLLWDRAIARERLFGIALDGLWMHVGTPEALAEAEQAIMKRPSS